MNRRSFLRQAVSAGALCLATGSARHAQAKATSPNIIFILTDDHGWTSVSYRSDPALLESMSDYIETPHLARMARAGMRFTDAYAPSAQCSPTRHGILFGQNAARHIYGKDPKWIENAPNWLTIPKVLKKADPGYRAAHFGKWHVGVLPEEMGFDFSDGITTNAQGDTQNGAHRDTDDVRDRVRQYNAEKEITPPTLNSSYSKPPVFYTDDDPKGTVSMARRAEAFMRESLDDGKPFFAYIAHFATHLDLVSTKETYEYFKNKPPGKKHDNPGFAAMAKDMDTSIGRVFDLVKELGIQDNTYIFIMSDNGGVQHFVQSATVSEDNDILETHETSVTWRNLPLRHGKHAYYEGGIRVPFIAVGPGIAANSVCRAPITGLDLLPTFAELSGYRTAFPDNIDGGSIVPVLRNAGTGKVERRRDALFFHQGGRRVPLSAVRKGKYKLVKHWLSGSPEQEGEKYTSEKVLELYDLSSDLGEANDLSESLPEVTKALHGELMAFLEEANGETQRTKRWEAVKKMKELRGIDTKKLVLIDPEYKSPFKRK